MVHGNIKLPHGICIEHARKYEEYEWNIYGMGMEYILNVCRIFMNYLWNMYRICMGHVWNMWEYL